VTRRELIALLGSTATTWPLGARAQQPAMPVVGYLSPGSAETLAPYVTAFRGGLKNVGYVEGQNVALEYRWAGDQYDVFPKLAGEPMRLRSPLGAASAQQAPLRGCLSGERPLSPAPDITLRSVSAAMYNRKFRGSPGALRSTPQTP
jgi:hypothetical protein